MISVCVNLNPALGYLDANEHVDRISYFKEIFTPNELQKFNKDIGVFTTSNPQRGGGASGIWTILSKENKKPIGEELVAGDAIYLKNDASFAEYLFCHTNELNNNNAKSTEFNESQHLVFTSPNRERKDGSRNWIISVTKQNAESGDPSLIEEEIEIQVGSVIHLENEASNGGYLDIRGWVTEKEIITHYQNPHAMALVSTHAIKNRSLGSGSWEIHSANGDALGKPIQIGSEVHLRNMSSDGGFLDTFEWARNLEHLKDYPMDVGNGVFTSTHPRRDGGETGTWIIKSASGKPEKRNLVKGDKIYLVNKFLLLNKKSEQVGYLRTHGVIHQHELFSDFDDGQRMVVFAGSEPSPTKGSPSWAVSTSRVPEDLYYLRGKVEIENDDEQEAIWIDFGVISFSGHWNQSLTSLKIASFDDKNKKLNGLVSYNGAQNIEFKAQWIENNKYQVSHHLNGRSLERYPNGIWTVGGRQDKKLSRIDVSSKDNGRTFNGILKYVGQAEKSIKIRGSHATAIINDHGEQTLIYDFFGADLWAKRFNKITNSLNTAVAILDDSLFSITDFSLTELAQLIDKFGGNSYGYLAYDYNQNGADEDKAGVYSDRFFDFLRQKDSIRDLTKNNKKLTNSNFIHLSEKLLELLLDTEYRLKKDESLTSSDVQNEGLNEIDSEYQINQLLNIYALSRTMSEFWEALQTSSKETIEKLNEANILPPVERIRTCFQQFTIDFEILQRAIQQRRWVKSAKNETFGNAQAISLAITDKLAAMSIAPIQHLLSRSDSDYFIPLTYFSKAIHIRQFPYTEQFVFVGLTYDLTSSLNFSSSEDSDSNEEESSPAFELMAIPHEVGHFVYHNARRERLESSETFVDIGNQYEDHPYHHWCEEIFSDLYGCLISGPFAVFAMQAILATAGKEDALENDEHHPTAVLRPFFMSQMLKELTLQKKEKYSFFETAMMMDANWTAVLERWGFVTDNVVNGRPSRITIPSETDGHVDELINVDRALELIEPIIKSLTEALVKNANFEPWETDESENELSATIPWSQKHFSSKGYIKQMKEFVGIKIASKPLPNSNLVEEANLNLSVKNEIDPDWNERIELVPTQLFKNILNNWKDNGPGGGYGDYD